MKKGFLTLFVSLLIFKSFLAGNVEVTHTVEKNSEKNEYKVTSLFLGATNADFAKVSFQIPGGVKVVTPSSGGNVAKKESNGISFYALSVSERGITTVFYVQPANDQEISIGVKFVYAVGEEKIKPSIENLIISPAAEDYVAYQGETPEDNSFEIKDFNSSTNEYGGTGTTEVTTNEIAENTEESGNFSIQLLSLSEYSDQRVMSFCIKHKLKSGDLIKRTVGSLTKVSIGRYSSKEAANAAKKDMIEGDALLDDAFVVSLK